MKLYMLICISLSLLFGCATTTAPEESHPTPPKLINPFPEIPLTVTLIGQKPFKLPGENLRIIMDEISNDQAIVEISTYQGDSIFGPFVVSPGNRFEFEIGDDLFEIYVMRLGEKTDEVLEGTLTSIFGGEGPRPDPKDTGTFEITPVKKDIAKKEKEEPVLIRTVNNSGKTLWIDAKEYEFHRDSKK